MTSPLDRFLFKTDPMTGNRRLRMEPLFVVGLAFGIGVIALLESRGSRPADVPSGLAMESDVIAQVGDRQIEVNHDMRNLLSTEPEVVDPLSSLEISDETTSPSPPPVARDAVAPKRSTSRTVTSFGSETYTPPARTGPDPVSSVSDVPPPTPIDWASLQQTTNSVTASTGSKTSVVSGGSSAVVFKRQDDATIQQRDGQQFDNLPGLAAGTIIPCEILTGIISGDTLPVIVVVTRNVLSQNSVVIPKGSMFLGTAEANFQARRIFVHLDRLIIGNAEIKIKGELQDGAGRAGLCDQYKDLAAGQLIPAFFAGLLSEFGRAFSSKSSLIQVGDGAAGTTITQAKGAFLTATGSGLDSVSQALCQRAAEAKAIIIVYPNRPVRMVLTQKIPFEWLFKAQGR